MSHRKFTQIPHPILIIQMQADLRQSWVVALTEAGFSTLYVHVVDHILPLIDEHRVSLVLLDTALASASSFVLVQALAESSGAPILLTYTADPQKRAAGLNAGAAGILTSSAPRIVVAQVQALLRETNAPGRSVSETIMMGTHRYTVKNL